MSIDWIGQTVFYHIYPLGFVGAPFENNQSEVVYSLDKLKDWIPHLKSMGVNAVYLGPVFSSTSHGYDTRDYYKIDNRLGDNDSFKEICDHLHANGIRIVLDGVFNHVGREFWAFKDVQKNGQSSRYCSWFHNLNFGGSSPMGDPFWYESWEGHYSLVKLNLRNPEVVEHLLGAVGLWMDSFRIDGLRLDAADCVDFDFFKQLKSFVTRKRPDFWLMGEIIHGDYNRWANPSMLNSTTNYECYKGLYSSHNDKNYFEIAYSLNRQFGDWGIYKNIYTYNFVDNHDVNRLASTLHNPEHIYNVYTLLFTMPGVPSIYYGSEWGIQGVKSNGSDAALRPCLELDRIDNPNQKLQNHIARLSSLRATLEALQWGDYQQTLVRNEQFMFQRRYGEQTVFVACNLADYPYDFTCEIAGDSLKNLLEEDQMIPVNNGHVIFDVQPFSSKILLVQ